MKMGFGSFGLWAALLLTPFSAVVHSFPTTENLIKIARQSDLTVEKINRAIKEHNEKRLLFDPLTTPISVSGEHAFQPPDFSKGDQRGSCPGLNSLANHGYLDRSGAVNLLDAILAINRVLGMGIDLTSLLSITSTVEVGNPVSLNPGFSIAGVSPRVQNLVSLLGLVAVPQGIDATHNLIESDGSSTRDDLYMTGDCSTMNMTKFLEVYNAIPVNGAMTMDDIAARSAKRFDESVANNPYFYYGPYSGIFARSGGYLFLGRLLSNHSRDYPRGGNMTRHVYASFLGVVKDSSGELVYKKGWERIPKNWYRSAVDYGVADVVVDLVDWISQYPKLGSVGGNVGTVNSFSVVDLGDVSGGLLNSGNLLKGNNLVCFSLQVLQMGMNNQLASVWATLGPILKSVLPSNPITGTIANLSCPIFTNMQFGGTNLLDGLMKKYPGAKKAGRAM